MKPPRASPLANESAIDWPCRHKNQAARNSRLFLFAVSWTRALYDVFFGAAPNFLLSAFIKTSKRLRAFFQESLAKGTWQSPCPLQAFSPGFSPQPPCPLHSFDPPQL